MALIAPEPNQANGKKLKIPELTFSDQNLGGFLLDRVDTLQKSGTFSDIVLRVEHKEFKCHKLILAASSDFFLSLFTNPDCKNPVCLKEIDQESFEHIFKYFYNGKLNVPCPEVPKLYKLSKKLRVKSVEKACCEFLINHINRENVLEIREITNRCRSGEGDLCQSAENFICANAESLLTRDRAMASHWIRMHASVIVDDMADDPLNKNILAELVVDFVHSKVEEEGITIEEMAATTPQLRLTPGYSLIEWNGSETDIVQMEAGIQKAVQQMEGDYTNKNSMKAMPRNGLNKRNRMADSTEELPLSVEMELESRLITSIEADNAFRCLAKIRGRLTVISVRVTQSCLLNRSSNGSPIDRNGGYVSENPLNGESPATRMDCSGNGNSLFSSSGSGCGQTREPIQLLGSMDRARSAPCAVVLGDDLVILGGYNRSESCMKSCEIFSPRQNSCLPFPNMLTPRSRFAAVPSCGALYALGGSGVTGPTARVEVWRPSDENEAGGEWHGDVAPIPRARSGHSAVELEDKIYLAGGSLGAESLADIHVYDPTVNVWTELSPMIQARSQAAMCSHGGRIFLVGGVEESGIGCLSTFEVFDPASGVWCHLPPLPQPRRGSMLVPFGDAQLYLVGGCDSQGGHRSCHIFDLNKNLWLPGPPLNVPRVNLATSIINNRLFAVGGFSGRHFLDNLEVLESTAEEWSMYITPSMLADRPSSFNSTIATEA